jgi:hypothetical protein
MAELSALCPGWQKSWFGKGTRLFCLQVRGLRRQQSSLPVHPKVIRPRLRCVHQSEDDEIITAGDWPGIGQHHAGAQRLCHEQDSRGYPLLRGRICARDFPLSGNKSPFLSLRAVGDESGLRRLPRGLYRGKIGSRGRYSLAFNTAPPQTKNSRSRGATVRGIQKTELLGHRPPMERARLAAYRRHTICPRDYAPLGRLARRQRVACGWQRRESGSPR